MSKKNTDKSGVKKTKKKSSRKLNEFKDSKETNLKVWTNEPILGIFYKDGKKPAKIRRKQNKGKEEPQLVLSSTKCESKNDNFNEFLYPDSSCDTHQDLRGNSALQEESGDLVKSYNEFEKEQTGRYEAKVSLIERGKEDKMVEKPLNSSRKYLDLLNAKLEPKENILLKCHKDSPVALPDSNCLAEAELGYRGRNDPEKESYIVIKNEHGSYFDNPKRSTKAVDQFTAISKLNLYKNPEEYDKLIRKEIRKKRRLMKKQNNSTSRERTCFTKHGFSKIQDKELVDIFLSKKKRKGKNRSVDKTSAVKVDTTSILSVHKPKFYKTTERSSETVRNATTRKVNVAPTNLQQNLDLPKIASRTPVRKLNLKQEDLIQPMPKPINLKSQIKVKSKSFFKRQSYAESAARKITSML